MPKPTTQSGQPLFPIGIGTWGIGGFAEKDMSLDINKQREALIYRLNQGANLIEVNHWYAEGFAAEILAEAFQTSNTKRDDVLLVVSFYPKGERTLSDATVEIEKTLKIFGTDYIDIFQPSGEAHAKFGDEIVMDFVQTQLSQGKVLKTSLTNENLPRLEEHYKRFKDKFAAHEVVFNFEIRENEDLGIIPYARDKKLLNILYQPIRRNRTALRNWPILQELSQKHDKTQNQIIFNWLVNTGYYPLNKSENIEHIRENHTALDFQMEVNDYELLTNWRPQNYQTPTIDWDWTGEGTTVDQLPNVFDDLCPTTTNNPPKKSV